MGVMRLFALAVTLVMLFDSQISFAQGRTVTGTITDASRSPLPGVSVQIKGTARGTSSGADGTYTLSNVGEGATLVFSFIGFTTQEVPVGNRSSVDVQLTDDTKALQEVVVIGYGTQRVKDATGSVVAIGPKDFNKGVIASPEQLLQGRAAGIQITPASGEPGAGVNIRIRGTTSIRSNNNPLFVVDGVPLDGGDVSDGGRDFGAGTQSARNPLTFLNPDDIENISVLKDASSAAIYGARGANGVVLITTKRGKSGQSALNFSANASVSSTLRRYDLVKAADYAAALRSAQVDVTSINNAGASTDWQDQIFRTSLSQNYNINYGGGNDNTRYNLSLGYSDQQGIVKNSGLRRITGRVNASQDLFNDKVTLDLQLTTSGIRDNYVPNGDNAGYQGNLIGAAIQANPTYPVYDQYGRFFNPDGYADLIDPATNRPIPGSGTVPNGVAFRNPVSLLEGVNDVGTTNRTLGNIGLTWRIIDGLSYKLNFGIDNSMSERRTSILRNLPGFSESILQNAGRGVIQNRQRSSQLLEHTLNYNQKIGPGQFDGVLGFSYQKFNNQASFLQAQLFQSTAVFPYTNNMNAVNNQGSNKAYFAGSDLNESELQSYFGRVNYNLNEKYLLTATVRVDGSSKFGPNNKYGVFPAFGAGWNISDEAFMQGVKEKGVTAKIRGSWGVTGNQEFPANITPVRYTFDQNNNATNRDIVNNDNLRWEQTRQFGIGADLTFFNGRLGATIDYFDKNTTDLLFEAAYAAPAPARARWINLPANIINRGVELGITYDIVRGENFTWDVAANGTFLKNEVTDFTGLYNAGAINGQGLTGAYAQRIVGGRPLFSFFMPTFTGFDASGFGQYTDPTLQLAYVGSAIPTYNFGLTNNFGYKGWSASLFITGAGGNYLYNNTANAIFVKGNLGVGRNVTTDVVTNGENRLNPPIVSTRFLEKGDFVRLSNLVISRGINLPAGSAIRGLRVSLTGQNLLVLTKYTGIDPEVNTNKTLDGIPSLGIDYTSFPTARTFTLGITGTF
ncbi:SusC/RagA family TonB-linked outer membrane protein [Tellurirhabdus rosea]|uniref:SusC/RagA family TonB-linked outer membrane protein n=1 Tax=Tellurirhabdus rosea TaxID=2674997 RepID=UPI0022551CA0|nr:SusC/RagA family TonB-linked outer membrane protein [Tellurirhabdus rosea]